MAAAWRALLKLLGIGAKNGEAETNKQVRYHPYDEVSDEALEERRTRPLRKHPYDEITDEQLKDKPPNSKTPRSHPYDTVLDPEPEPPAGHSGKGGPTPKMKIAAEENGTPEGSGLHYVEVEVQSGKGKDGARPTTRPVQESTIYSEVRPSAAS